MAETSRPPIYSVYGTDPDMAELVDLFVAGVAETADAVRAAVAQEDWDAVRRGAHKVKGSAAGYGFEELGEEAGRLESLIARDGSLEVEPDEIREAVDRFESVCRRIRPGAGPAHAA